MLGAPQDTPESMNTPAAPDHFELQQSHACYAPIGRLSVLEIVRLVDEAILFARDQQCERLLVDLTRVIDLPSPSLPERYWIVRQWARSATNRVAIALVLQPYLIDPERFGVQVAVNLGTRADVFTEKPAALAWLVSDQLSSVQSALTQRRPPNQA